MDKLGYITGDLVMTNGIPIGTKKGIVYQVTESNADKDFEVPFRLFVSRYKRIVVVGNKFDKK